MFFLARLQSFDLNSGFRSIYNHGSNLRAETSVKELTEKVEQPGEHKDPPPSLRPGGSGLGSLCL